MTREEGVKETQNFDDIIYRWPLTEKAAAPIRHARRSSARKAGRKIVPFAQGFCNFPLGLTQGERNTQEREREGEREREREGVRERRRESGETERGIFHAHQR